MKKSEDNKHFHLWIPNIFNCRGGIQVYSDFFLQALQNLFPESQFDIFLKQDVQTSTNITYLPETRFHFAGTCPLKIRTAMFATQIIHQGIQQRPDLVIATHLNFTIAAHWLKRITGIPYWTVAHGIEAWDIKNPALKSALLNADKILAVSNYTRNRLLELENLAPEKVSLLPNTFDADRFQIRNKPVHLLKRYGLNEKQPIILTVARLCQSEQYKGYDKIIAALPKIRQTIPNVHYLLVGKGDDIVRIKQLISQLDLTDCVTLPGFVSDKELSDYYNLCDVFAMPSQKEGFGIVYLEALASGKPTVGGNQDGALDALCHGELGALINPNDVEAIAETLMQILQGSYPNPLLYQPQLLRERVIERYGFERFQHTLSKSLKEHFTSKSVANFSSEKLVNIS